MENYGFGWKSNLRGLEKQYYRKEMFEMKKTKNFVLVSGNEEGWHWRILVSVNANGTFKNKSKIQLQNYKEQYQRKPKDKKVVSEYHKKYYLENREHILECAKEYKKTEKGKEVEKRAKKKYRETEKGGNIIEKCHKKYVESEKGKKTILGSVRKYSKTEKGRKTQHRKDAKRRNLGFVEINERFAGSEAHHINKECVIHIPKEIHHSVWHNVWTGKGMEEINALAFEYVYGSGLDEMWGKLKTI